MEIDTIEPLQFDPTHVPKIAGKDLPADVKWFYFAEMHRIQTGEVLTAEEYKNKYGDPAKHGKL